MKKYLYGVIFEACSLAVFLTVVFAIVIPSFTEITLTYTLAFIVMSAASAISGVLLFIRINKYVKNYLVQTNKLLDSVSKKQIYDPSPYLADDDLRKTAMRFYAICAEGREYVEINSHKQETLQEMLETMPCAVCKYDIDTNGEALDFNSRVLELLDISEEDFFRLHHNKLDEFIDPRDREMVLQIYRSESLQDEYSVTFDIISAKGKRKSVLELGSRTYYEDKNNYLYSIYIELK